MPYKDSMMAMPKSELARMDFSASKPGEWMETRIGAHNQARVAVFLGCNPKLSGTHAAGNHHHSALAANGERRMR